MASFGVVGATTWGTTLAWMLANNGHPVSLVCRTEAEAAAVSANAGIARLPEITLPPTVAPVTPGRIPEDVRGLVVAVPAQSLRATMSGPGFNRSLPVLSAAKGIELESGRRMSEVLAACGWAPDRVSALSGPNLAHEIARGLPAAAVVASHSADAPWQEALNSHSFRVYSSTDVTGVELAGALKNVVAIAAGIAAGREAGVNAVAAIMTRGLAEMTRLGVAFGAQAATFHGLAGVGDLAATCFSQISRNQRLGRALARGASAAEAMREIGEAVEGAATAKVAVDLARRAGVEAPIAEAVAAVVSGRITVSDAIEALLTRPPRPENDSLP